MQTDEVRSESSDAEMEKLLGTPPHEQAHQFQREHWRLRAQLVVLDPSLVILTSPGLALPSLADERAMIITAVFSQQQLCIRVEFTLRCSGCLLESAQ